MNEIQLRNIDGEFYADSREVAEKIKRPLANLNGNTVS